MQANEERTWVTLTHLGGIIGSLVIAGVGNILGALIFWLIKRNDSKFIDEQGKEALNFQITVSLVTAALGILAAIRFGFWDFNMFMNRGDWDFSNMSFFAGSHGIIWILNVVFSIIAAVRANKGIPYRYPVSLRLVK